MMCKSYGRTAKPAAAYTLTETSLCQSADCAVPLTADRTQKHHISGLCAFKTMDFNPTTIYLHRTLQTKYMSAYRCSVVPLGSNSPRRPKLCRLYLQDSQNNIAVRIAKKSEFAILLLFYCTGYPLLGSDCLSLPVCDKTYTTQVVSQYEVGGIRNCW